MEESQAIAEAPATAATTVADAPSQPDLGAELIENASVEQLDQLFEKGSLTLKPAPGGEEKKGEEAPPAAKIEPKAGEQPPVVDTPPAKVEEVVETRTPEEIAAAEAEAKAKEDEVTGIERPRLKDERDQLIAGIYMKAKREGNPLSWAEAEARVDGPKVEAQAPIIEAPVDYGAIVGTLETEVADIRRQLTEAGSGEGLYTAEIAKLNMDLAEKTADLKLAQRDAKEAKARTAREEAETRKASEKNRTDAIAQAKSEYPDAADDTTPLGKAVKESIDAMKNPRHPDHALLFADSVPLIVTQREAQKLGIAPKKSTTPPPAKAKVEAPPRKVVNPAPGNKTAVVPAKPAEDAKQTVEYLKSGKATLAELDAAFGMEDPTKLLAGAVR